MKIFHSFKIHDCKKGLLAKFRSAIIYFFIFQFILNWFFIVPFAFAAETPAGTAGNPSVSRECQQLSADIPQKTEEFRIQLKEVKAKFSPQFFLSLTQLIQQQGELSNFESQMNTLALTSQTSKSLLQQWARLDCGKNKFENLKSNWLKVAADYNDYINAILKNSEQILAILKSLKWLSPVALILNFFAKKPQDISISMEDLNYDKLVGKSQQEINIGQTPPDIFGTTVGTTTTQIQPFQGFTGQELNEWLDRPEVIGVWKFSMSVVNYLTLIFLIFTAFANILRLNIQTYAIKKILPSLILSVILANFSLFIAKIIIDFNTVLVTTINEVVINSIRSSSNNIVSLLFEGILKPLRETALNAITKGGLLAIWFIFSGPGLHFLIIGFIFGMILYLIFIGFFLWLWFLFQIRGFIILLLVVFAPIAFVSLGFPLTQKYFQMWWSQFTRWVFMAPAVLLVLALTAIIGGSGIGGIIGGFIFTIAGLYFASQVPFKLGGAAMAAWGGIGKGVAGLIGRPIKGWAGVEYEARIKKPALAAFAKTKIGKVVTGARIGRELRSLATEREIKQAEMAVWYQKDRGLRERRSKKGYKYTAEDRIIAQQMRNSYLERSSEWEYASVANIEQDLWGNDEKKRDYAAFLAGGIEDYDDANKIGGLIKSLQKKKWSYDREERGRAEGLMNTINDYTDTDETQKYMAQVGTAGFYDIRRFDPLYWPSTQRTPKMPPGSFVHEPIGISEDFKDSIERSTDETRLGSIKSNLSQAGFADANFAGINEALKKGETADKIFKFQPTITAAGMTAPDVTKSGNFQAAIQKIFDSLPAQEEISIKANLDLKVKEIEDMAAAVNFRPPRNLDELKNIKDQLGKESPSQDIINRSADIYHQFAPPSVISSKIQELKIHETKNIRELRGRIDSVLRATSLIDQGAINPETIREGAKVTLRREWEVEKVKNTLKKTFSNEIPDNIRRMITNNEKPIETLRQTIKANIDTLIKTSAPNVKLETPDYDTVTNKLLGHISKNIGHGELTDINTLLEKTSTQISQAVLGEFDNLEKVKSAREQTTKQPPRT